MEPIQEPCKLVLIFNNMKGGEDIVRHNIKGIRPTSSSIRNPIISQVLRLTNTLGRVI